ncbi:hypothetical protein FB45DRAFT_873311 [Roridomyces roridus]|uniref:Uncharacterized protein n=1 Tax=Roridomyces roridus TaxID=1738132 RepID=A0AAD7BB26_9AGAR|nr:hypothetical protein FB45DRAFT_873311 [Roridomyces roridus]
MERDVTRWACPSGYAHHSPPWLCPPPGTYLGPTSQADVKPNARNECESITFAMGAKMSISGWDIGRCRSERLMHLSMFWDGAERTHGQCVQIDWFPRPKTPNEALMYDLVFERLFRAEPEVLSTWERSLASEKDVYGSERYQAPSASEEGLFT